MEDKRKKLLIAVSGGPDSMALLSLYKDEYDLSVAHINYHHRDSADRDEKIVKDFCVQHSLPFYKKDYVEVNGGNFQDNARRFRYDFFKELIRKHQLSGLLVAHHLDDFLETYVMQKEKGVETSWFGLRETSVRDSYIIYRPLLKYEKKELLAYCDEHDIPYGIDESNLSDDYRRNQIRHQIIERMDRAAKKDLYLEAMSRNKKYLLKDLRASSYIGGRSSIPVDDNIDAFVLRNMIYRDISSEFIKEVLRQLKTCDRFEMDYRDKVIVKEYGELSVYTKEADYCVTLSEFTLCSHKHFKIEETGDSFSAVTLHPDDYPLTVRNFRPGDQIRMRFGHKKLSRFFKDKKIRSYDRQYYPVLCNKRGDIILVPGLGPDCDHYSIKPDMFMVKL